MHMRRTFITIFEIYVEAKSGNSAKLNLLKFNKFSIRSFKNRNIFLIYYKRFQIISDQFLKSSLLNMIGQTKRSFTGSIYGRSSIRLPLLFDTCGRNVNYIFKKWEKRE
jgi:hypothetical protein